MKKVVNDRELVYFTMLFKETALDGHNSRGKCLKLTAALVPMLNVVGVPCVLTTGDVWATNVKGEVIGRTFHAWVTLKDGRILDPTLEQFPEARTLEMNAGIYLGRKLEWMKAHGEGR